MYLHEQNRFEIWLGGGNRKIQAEYIAYFKQKDIGSYQLSQVGPGVDSILVERLEGHPNFDQTEDLITKIGHAVLRFADSVIRMIES